KQNDSSTIIPNNIQYDYAYKPSVQKNFLTIKIIGNAELPNNLINLIEKLKREDFSFTPDQTELLTQLISSAPSVDIARPIQVEPFLKQNGVIIEIHPDPNKSLNLTNTTAWLQQERE